MVKFTIITVCYNSGNSIAKTIESVIEQKNASFEYIIIDGGSTDNTTQIVSCYRENFDIVYLTEKDNGIYDAMNKGIRLSRGEYILFLNVGDYFLNDFVLQNVNTKIKQAAIYYGDVESQGLIVNQPNKVNNLFMIREFMICHQGIFAHRESFVDNLFDVNYRYCADRNWLIRTYYRKKLKFTYLNMAVVHYDSEGVSSIKDNQQEINKEVNIIERNNYTILFIF